MKLGYTLKRHREAKHLPQQEVALKIEVSQRTYSNFESCKSIPSLILILW